MRIPKRTPTSRLARLGGPVVLIKTGLTLTAFAAAAYSRWLGRKLEAAGVESLDNQNLSQDVAAKLRRQQMLSRVIPLLSGTLVVVGAVEGERLRTAKTSPFARALDTVSFDKSTLGHFTDKVSETVDKVDLHKITPDFVEERRLPEALAKLAS
ncbi:MAG: hypothetical protein ABWZ99_08040 [Ilumatobacteraceae bacterium]